MFLTSLCTYFIVRAFMKEKRKQKQNPTEKLVGEKRVCTVL